MREIKFRAWGNHQNKYFNVTKSLKIVTTIKET